MALPVQCAALIQGKKGNRRCSRSAQVVKQLPTCWQHNYKPPEEMDLTEYNSHMQKTRAVNGSSAPEVIDLLSDAAPNLPQTPRTPARRNGIEHHRVTPSDASLFPHRSPFATPQNASAIPHDPDEAEQMARLAKNKEEIRVLQQQLDESRRRKEEQAKPAFAGSSSHGVWGQSPGYPTLASYTNPLTPSVTTAKPYGFGLERGEASNAQSPWRSVPGGFQDSPPTPSPTPTGTGDADRRHRRSMQQVKENLISVAESESGKGKQPTRSPAVHFPSVFPSPDQTPPVGLPPSSALAGQSSRKAFPPLSFLPTDRPSVAEKEARLPGPPTGVPRDVAIEQGSEQAPEVDELRRRVSEKLLIEHPELTSSTIDALYDSLTQMIGKGSSNRAKHWTIQLSGDCARQERET